jgi:hypothetical protein
MMIAGSISFPTGILTLLDTIKPIPSYPIVPHFPILPIYLTRPILWAHRDPLNIQTHSPQASSN